MVFRSLFVFLIAGMGLWGQVPTASLTGYVLDPTGAAIAGAKVKLADPLHGGEREATANAQGLYRFGGLPAASYVLSGSATRFATASVSDVVLTVGETRRLDLTLALEGQREVVQVADAAPLRTESATLGLTLEESRIRQLPLNRRDFLQLALLAPGIAPPVQGSELSTRGGFSMHAAGGREESNQFLLDGVDNNDPYNNRYVLQPQIESIREFRVTTSQYSAEFGRAGGAQVNVVTRGGSNEWHGELFHYFRNRQLDSRGFFEGAEKAKLQRNQFGGALGGPIARNRTFFHVNIGSLVERRGIPRLGTVPTAEERAGQLSSTVTDPFTQQPFPGNRIPASRTSPQAKNVLALYPMPNRAGVGQNYASQPALRETLPQGSGRLDHTLSEKDQLTVRYSYGRQDLFEPFAEESVGLPGFGNFVANYGHNAMVNHSRVIRPNLLHSLRLGYTRSFREIKPENFATDAGQLWGVNWLNVQERDRGFPAISLAGYSTAGDGVALPLGRVSNTYHLNECVQWMAGGHSLKIGVDARRQEANGYLDYFARGQLIFSGDLTGSGIGDLLLGFPVTTIQAQFNNPQTLKSYFTGAWVQDDWKVNRRLTLNLGVRYEYFSPVKDRFNRLMGFDPATGGLRPFTTTPDRNNWAPRVGAAFALRERTVLRAGYGVHYDAGMFVINSSQYFNPPDFNIRVWFPSAAGMPTLQNPFPQNGGFSPPATLSSVSPSAATPYMQHWSGGVEQQIGSATTVSLSYVGSKGTKLIRSRDLNQPLPGPGAVGGRRPSPQFSNIFFVETAGNSNYHSLQAHLNRRSARGLSWLASYTYGKSIDEISAFIGDGANKNFPQNSRDFKAERAVSNFDVRQRFVTAGTWVAPWKLELRTIITAQSGQPFSPLLQFDNSNTGNIGSIFGNDRPNLVRKPSLANPSAEKWFDTEAFAIPPANTFGNAGRNILRGPGLATVDLAVARRFSLGERMGLTATVEAFNLLNRTNLDLPERYIDSPVTFGRIGSAKPPRQLQLALRFQF